MERKKTSLDDMAVERIADCLHREQEKMTEGKNWNLNSDAACHMLAEKIWEDMMDFMKY